MVRIEADVVLPGDPRAFDPAFNSDGDANITNAVVVDNEAGMQYGGADDRRAGSVVGLPAL